MSSNNLRASRQRLGLTLQQMAELLGVHQSQLSRWETGRRPVPPFLALAVAHLACRSMRAAVRSAAST